MENPIATNSHAICLTLSVGVAEVEPSDVDCMAVLKRADVKLYKAKENGRNRVES